MSFVSFQIINKNFIMKGLNDQTGFPRPWHYLFVHLSHSLSSGLFIKMLAGAIIAAPTRLRARGYYHTNVWIMIAKLIEPFLSHRPSVL